MWSGLCRFILKISGWKVHGLEELKRLNQYIIIVAPHTSNWDFIVGMLVRYGNHLTHVKYLGKDSLFRFPYGFLFKAMGGFPVDRSKKNNLVDSYVDFLQTHPQISIVIAPEGTRHKVEHFKTGFYFIAKGAKIPVICCPFDFKNKTVSFDPPFYCTENSINDLEVLENRFKGVEGKNPKYNFT
ncbi:MAG TPA: 1-acyl-sn-glycerol-3-phosphate acyltransferase [Saprospiraceae bacterium]|nr:1-acyl-sn-glycerol-3-phosphate acyltransferase [Saprospiraceae bacterium]